MDAANAWTSRVCTRLQGELSSGEPLCVAGGPSDESSSDLSESVTAYVSSSPRSGDQPTGLCYQALSELLSSLHQLLPRSPLVVIFDGPHPTLLEQHEAERKALRARRPLSTTSSTSCGYTCRRVRSIAYEPGLGHLAQRNATRALEAYAAKIAATRAHPTGPTVFEHSMWLHQGLALREALRACTTPLVMSVQEDVELLRIGEIRTHVILSRLLCDNAVEYIMLYWSQELGERCYGQGGSGACAGALGTKGEHPQQRGLYRLRDRSWGDRPHFARLSTYRQRVFPLLEHPPTDYRAGNHSLIETLVKFVNSAQVNRSARTRIIKSSSNGTNATSVEPRNRSHGLEKNEETLWGLWLYAPTECLYTAANQRTQCGMNGRSFVPSANRSARPAHASSTSRAPPREQRERLLCMQHERHHACGWHPQSKNKAFG